MITYEREKCTKCGTCLDVCPQLTIDWGSDGFPVQARPHDCMECGACAKNCPAAAVHVAAGVGCFSALVNETLFGKKDGCGCG
ncbi:MAG: 4Fe-4S dicluster domain-containing protein [bacterium]